MYHASKKEFLTRYLFKEQGTFEGSEWFQIDLKCDQGALSDSYILYARHYNPLLNSNHT